MNLILIGISGSGKGTQGELLANKYHLKHISTGELFRQEYEKKSPEGLHAYSFWGQGKWVPDEVTFALLRIYLMAATNGFVLDGYPRTLVQCQMLDSYLADKSDKLDLVIYLKVSSQEALKRLFLRSIKDTKDKGKSREDEKEEIIKARFKSFLESVEPVLSFFQKKKILFEVDGEKSIEEIFKDIINKIENKV